MHFLCLHGRGTSSKILQMQTAALRYELGDEHSYTFIQGIFECDMAPDIAHLSSPDFSHYEFYSPKDVHSYLRALEYLEIYIANEGPFDGILGFSQGAGLALMYLIRHNHLHPTVPPPFRVAILFSRIGVYDPARWLEKGESVILESLPPGVNRISIPIAALWGNRDWATVRSEGNTTKSIGAEGMVWEFVHNGGHEVPSANVEGSVQGSVKVIQRAITQAIILGSNQ